MPFSSEELPELKRQSSTRTIIVDFLLSLCFDGSTFAERTGSLEGLEGEKVSLQRAPQAAYLSWSGSAPLWPLHAQFGLAAFTLYEYLHHLAFPFLL